MIFSLEVLLPVRDIRYKRHWAYTFSFSHNLTGNLNFKKMILSLEVLLPMRNIRDIKFSSVFLSKAF